MQERIMAPVSVADLELSDDQLDAVVGGLTRVFVGPQDVAPVRREWVQIPGLALHREAEPALQP